jgi:deferrochelatase/peroxidase EfeB
METPHRSDAPRGSARKPWEHDATAWDELRVAGQDAFGRIFRRNIPYGTLTSHGTIFVGFSADQRILDAMLRSMVGTDGRPPDALTTVTRALTGAYYVVPSIDALSALGGDERAGD